MTLSNVAVEALKRVRRVAPGAPIRSRDPVAWAAYQGLRTARGIHTLSDTTALMALGPAIQSVWEEIVKEYT